MSETIKALVSSPTTIIALIGVLVLLVGLLVMKKVKLNTKTITIIGVTVALTTVLNMLKVFQMPQGGSITLGGMIPILLIALIYGPEVGMLTGFIYGFIDFLMGGYIAHPIQVLFDYPLPFMMLGVAGYFKNKDGIKVILGMVLAVLLRFGCHFLSGVVFWGSYAPEGMSPYVYSFVYNISYLGIEGLLCIGIVGLLPIRRIQRTIVKSDCNRQVNV